MMLLLDRLITLQLLLLRPLVKTLLTLLRLLIFLIPRSVRRFVRQSLAAIQQSLESMRKRRRELATMRK
ncbi:hypothetical protein ANAPH2_00314 [Anaplasma phagocytophilum]|nr:hypothetical protein ANAPH2_00314 [Anaplasma phagocytophilum]